MQDFADFLVSVPETMIPWIGIAGMLCVYLGVKIQISFLRMLTIGAGIFLFVFTFLWMLQWLNVYGGIGAALVS